MNRTLAHFLSLVFHPMLLPTYALLLLMAVNPYAFGLRSMFDAKVFPMFLMIFFSTFLIPCIGITLLKPLGFIDSYQLETQRERHGPYIITAIFYLWVLKNLLSKGIMPPLFTAFLLGATLGLFLAFFANIFFKISAHAVGMGGLVAAILLTIFYWGGSSLSFSVANGSFLLSLNLILWLSVILAGLVGVARLSLRAHEPFQIYLGFAAGFAAMFFAVYII